MAELKDNVITVCDHCGDQIVDDGVVESSHHFCCSGCATVFNILSENGMSNYYKFQNRPGISQKHASKTDFSYLDDPTIENSLVAFKEDSISKITLHLPDIHCSSCLWLLENLNQLNEGITHVFVNFPIKKATLTFDHTKTTLKSVFNLLDKIGYPPNVNLESIEGNSGSHLVNKKLLYKLGMAGFSFGNVMLLSFPEYLGFDKASYLFHIGYINIILSIPVLFYSGFDYLKNAWVGIKSRVLNLDLPIALGMLTLFLRSVYEILSHHGEGYLDSFTGFVFFLLIGRWFQSFTYTALDFNRSYKSYFPISGKVFRDGKWTSISLGDVMKGDRIKVKNGEIVPLDGILLSERSSIDYSFVTGESKLIKKAKGDLLFAGGKHVGSAIEIHVEKKIDESYLTQLWNEDVFKNNDPTRTSQKIAQVSKYFTIIILSIALFTFVYWAIFDPSIMFLSFVSVLIVACPCALALAIPFTYGNIMRLLSEKGMYLRNVETIERLQDIEHIVFDKTGTITDTNTIHMEYNGMDLDENVLQNISALCSQSSHPLSRAIVDHIGNDHSLKVDQFKEEIGQGIKGRVNDINIKLGSSSYIFGSKSVDNHGVFIEIDGVYKGVFEPSFNVREGFDRMINSISNNYKYSLLSGDTDQDQEYVYNLLPDAVNIQFNQSPKDKLEFIKREQSNGLDILMIGDGLNDAGALQQSNVGLVVTDKVNNFSPSCDVIFTADRLKELSQILDFIRSSKQLINTSFVLAFMYNFIGLLFAVSGNLSPVVAAILMPLSSISIIVFGTLSSYLLYRAKL